MISNFALTRPTSARFGLILSVALLGVAGQGAMAQGSTTRDPNVPASTLPAATADRSADAGKVPRSDASFLKDVAQAGFAEIDASKLALAKSADPEVKAFAQQMVDDHTKVGEEVAALAARKGVELPKEASLPAKAKIKVLDMRKDKSFDEHYVKSFGVSAHEDTIKLFQKEAKEGKDADVKAFAAKTLPALEHHLHMAQALKARTDKAAK